MEEYAGKRKCQNLRALRKAIAKVYDIEIKIAECKHKGNCKGVCPKCDEEVIQLVKELARRNIVISEDVAATICATAGDGDVVHNFGGENVISEGEASIFDYDDGLMGDYMNESFLED